MKKILTVRFQDGTIISRDKLTDTYIDCLEKIGLQTVHSLGISARDKSFVNLVSKETDGINYTEVDGWFVFRKLGIEGVAKNLEFVSDRLNLGLEIDVQAIDGWRDSSSELRVFIDGKEITRNSGAKTFAEAIKTLGESRVQSLGRQVSKRNLVSRTNEAGYTSTGNGFYVWTKTTTSQKAKILGEIARDLGQDINIILK